MQIPKSWPYNVLIIILNPFEGPQPQPSNILKFACIFRLTIDNEYLYLGDDLCLLTIYVEVMQNVEGKEKTVKVSCCIPVWLNWNSLFVLT